MERSFISLSDPLKASDVKDVVRDIFDNAFGNPIVLKGVPTNAQMKANTWGVYGSYIYIKFGNNVLLRFTGTVIS